VTLAAIINVVIMDLILSVDWVTVSFYFSATVFGVSTNSMQLSFDTRGNSVPTILLMMQKRLYALGGLRVNTILPNLCHSLLTTFQLLLFIDLSLCV